MKRILSVLLVAAITATMLCGCETKREDSLSVEAAEAYLDPITEAYDDAYEMIGGYDGQLMDSLTMGILWDLDDDGMQELVLSYVCEIISPQTGYYVPSYVYDVYDYHDDRLRTLAEKEPIDAWLAAGSEGYTGVVIYRGEPRVMSYTYGGETSPMPGHENWEWEVTLYEYGDFDETNVFAIDCQDGRKSYSIDGAAISYEAFAEKMDGFEYLELTRDDGVAYTYDAMSLPEMLRHLHAVAGKSYENLSREEPTEPLPEVREIIAVDAGRDHTAVLYSDGTVEAIGGNACGQCDTSDWTDIAQISTLKHHTVGVRSDGTVVATGLNTDGQCNVSSWKNIVAVSAGEHHTVGLRSDGTVVAAGKNQFGECDVDDWSNIVAVGTAYTNTVGLCADGTVIVSGSYTKGKISGWKDIVKISVSDAHIVGLCADGTVKAVGTNNHNQCDVSSWSDIVAISAGCAYTMGLRSNGTVLVQGINDCGQHEAMWWNGIVDIATGLEHIIGIKEDGTLIAVGANDNGQCNVESLNP